MYNWIESAFHEPRPPANFYADPTAVTIDHQIIGLSTLFAVPSLAFLIVLPGYRRHKLLSALSFYLTMITGAVLLLSIHHPCWHRAEIDIYSTMSHRSSQKTSAHLMVRIGLQFMNISLTGSEPGSRLRINERFSFDKKQELDSVLHEGLTRGVPIPILTVLEYFTCDSFPWGIQYRAAGYYTMATMWLAVLVWIGMVASLFFVPHTFCRCVLATGLTILIGDIIFYVGIPKIMRIKFETLHDGMMVLNFKMSICFHATLCIAIVCITIGALLWLSEAKHIFQLETVFTAKRNARESVIDRPPLRSIKAS